ncbi:FkbM family methyltransferase [Pseudomonas sp. HS-18]|uniref:FkbM family methyltransferase n=1 Tax=Pseudomonas sp. HS-18 TaxID=2879114 RepID=UPI001CF04877|nr:FkbM family methyltransferase [Pseudomonas sp. HS-18]UCL88108.1 FkbM family methyltransferase [Pseudomonas sp. HS-18]
MMTTMVLGKIRHFANRFPLGRRNSLLPRVMRRLFRTASGQAVVDDFDGAFQMRLDLAEHMQRRIFWTGYYNREIVALLDKLIEPGMVVLDIGANIGEITLVAAKRTTERGQVIAFEPMSAIADQLEEHVQSNSLEWVTVVRAGLSDHCGEAAIYNACAQWDDSEPNRGLGSLYADQPNAKPVQSIALLTLDDYLQKAPIKRLDIIKIDIEGAELPCLKGALDTLRRFRPMLIIELQAETSKNAGYEQTDILDLLAGLGYEFQSIGQNGRLERLARNDLRDFQNVLCTHTAGAARP